MENPLQSLFDAVAELQGQEHAHATMLEALVMAHPDPEALRKCWHRISAPRIAAAATDTQTKGRAADEACRNYLLTWQEKLEKHHPAGGRTAP